MRHILAWDCEHIVSEIEKHDCLELEERKKAAADIIELKKILQYLEVIKKQGSDGNSAHLSAILTEYFPYMEKLNSNGKLDTKYRRSLLLNALNSLNDDNRVDTCALCDLYGLDPEMRDEENSGFMIYLRKFSMINAEKVHLDRHKWLDDSESYLRVCRLRGIYKSDLLQKFANFFVRVGLEDARKESHKHVFNHVVTKLVPDVP